MSIVLLILITLSPVVIVQPRDCSIVYNVTNLCSSVSHRSYIIVGTLLTCVGDNSTISEYPGISVTSVFDTSKNSTITNLENIQGLFIAKAPLFKFIPSGIKRIFPNLKAIIIESSGLLCVNKEDLKEFGSSLQYLELFRNLLTFIDANLFEYNQNLTFINLSFNPLRYIEPAFFTNLKIIKSLEQIHLNIVGCMDQYFATASGHNIKTFIWSHEGCSDESAKTEMQNFINNEACSEVKSNITSAEVNHEVNNISSVNEFIHQQVSR